MESSDKQSFEVMLINALGQSVIRPQQARRAITLHTGDLAAGIYILIVSDGPGRQQCKTLQLH